MQAVLDLRPLAPAAIVAVTGLVVLPPRRSPKRKSSPPPRFLPVATALASVWMSRPPRAGAVMANAAADELAFLQAAIRHRRCRRPPFAVVPPRTG
jgi:hypothetical protein